MRSVEWVTRLEQYLAAYHCAVINYQVTPNSETERALVDAKRRLVNFARSDGDVEVEE